jgi:hypothetical protein
VDEFGLRINSLVENMRGLGEDISETRIVKKILRVLPKAYSQVARSPSRRCLTSTSSRWKNW